MRGNDAYAWISRDDACFHELQQAHRIFEWRRDGPGKVMRGKDRRAAGKSRGMDEEECLASIQFGKQRFKCRVSYGCVEHPGRHRDSHHAKFITRPRDFGERSIDMGQWKASERQEAPRVLPNQIGVQVVRNPCRFQGTLLIPEVRRLRGNRQDLQIDTGVIHHPETCLEIGRLLACQEIPSDRRADLGSAQAIQQIKIPHRKIVGMHVDPHIRLLPSFGLNGLSLLQMRLASRADSIGLGCHDLYVSSFGTANARMWCRFPEKINSPTRSMPSPTTWARSECGLS